MWSVFGVCNPWSCRYSQCCFCFKSLCLQRRLMRLKPFKGQVWVMDLKKLHDRRVLSAGDLRIIIMRTENKQDQSTCVCSLIEMPLFPAAVKAPLRPLRWNLLVRFALFFHWDPKSHKVSPPPWQVSSSTFTLTAQSLSEWNKLWTLGPILQRWLNTARLCVQVSTQQNPSPGQC